MPVLPVCLLTPLWEQFAALLPAIRDHQHLGASTLNAMFAIYAVGLLPGLLIGGRASDALGRQSVAWAGSATALLGTVAMRKLISATTNRRSGAVAHSGNRPRTPHRGAP